MNKLSIRPGYLPYALCAAIALTAGSTLFGNGMIREALFCWALIVPILLATLFDRIEFDGKAITHRGPLPLLLNLAFGVRRQIAIADIEAITTEVITFSFSNGDSRNTYHTRIGGGGFELTIRSHRRNYPAFIKAVFQAAGLQKLDPRSQELYEYFENTATVKDFPFLKNDIETLPLSLLRKLGNALRLAGRLSQASNYFHVAYEKEPRNAGLLYEMSRYLRSSAHNKDTRMMQRSDACLRLASRLARQEPDLMERIGEVFFERFDYRRAAECFRKALEFDSSRFRSNIGMAEIALRDGKLAHVAHFYNAASGSNDAALARMARREANYYQRLVSDDEFLEKELRRIRFLNQVRWARRLSALSFLIAWMIASVIGKLSLTLQKYGWALMATSAMVWFGCTFVLRFFNQRRMQQDF